MESPPEFPPELPPEARREPLLTLPGALTAYVLLLVVIHVVRMLLPFDLDDVVIQMFGFIPKRYDSTLLALTFPGGGGAKVWIVRDLFAAARQSQPYRIQRAVAVAVRQRAGAPLRRGRGFSRSWR